MGQSHLQPDSGFIEANGVRLHYLTWALRLTPHLSSSFGAAQDERGTGAVLLMHPTGFLARTWQPVAELLAADGYRVYAYDARGHGDSDKPAPSPVPAAPDEDPYHWRNMVDDLRTFLDRLDLRGVPIIGHSMGGGVSAYLAAHHPEYVSRLVLIEPIILPPGPHPDPETRNSLAEGARKRRMVFGSVDDIVESYANRVAFERWQPGVLRLYAEHGTFLREDGRRELKCSGEIEGRVFDQSPSLDTWDAVPNIAAPILVVRGEHTEGMLANICEGVASRAPNTRLLVIPGAGHMVPMEKPDAIAREVLSFMNRNYLTP